MLPFEAFLKPLVSSNLGTTKTNLTTLGFHSVLSPFWILPNLFEPPATLFSGPAEVARRTFWNISNDHVLSAIEAMAPSRISDGKIAKISI